MAYMEEQLFSAIGSRLKALEMRTIFDVGANVGQSTDAFATHYAGASVWAFEPIAATYKKLSERFAGNDRIRCINAGLSFEQTAAEFFAEGTSVGNRLAPSTSTSPARREQVALEVGDSFMAAHGIDRVNYLKIDTEGHDLSVMRGFARALADHRIDLVQAEVGLHPRNGGHVPIEKVKSFLEAMDYALFTIIDMTVETRGRPNLRRCDVVFISQSAIEKNTVTPA